MKRSSKILSPSILLVLSAAASMALWSASATAAVPEAETPGPPVTVDEDALSFTLSNGIVVARVSKRTGDLTSLVYRGMETLTDRSGHAGGYWSHDTTGGVRTETRVTIDPKSNGGQRGEVSVKGISGGTPMGHGPGAASGGDFPADIDIRYCLGQGEPGVYTYCTFEHLAEYPAATMTEARFCAKLASAFDWISVDEKRNKSYPQPIPGEDKYVYTTVQFDNRAFGFSSTTEKLGWWIVNPTVEYLSGGPTKPEFLCHRDTTTVAAPCVLNYWRSSHYGGANVTVAAGEHWTKVIGPFLLYINTGDDPMALWRDARARAEREKAKWPYAWVAGVDYPGPGQRSDVSGQLILNDPLMPGGPKLTGRLLVGLASPPYTVAAGPGGAMPIDWQTDAKHYQFWAASSDGTGRFTIPQVRPGAYTLYALADGVLGELRKDDITVEPGGKPLDLGSIEWAPVRRGRQLWDVGIANRTAEEFRNGTKFFEPDITLQYATLFPDDVNYIIGKSDFRQDWYYAHVPHGQGPDAAVRPFSGVAGNGRATPYRIEFDLADAPRGTATLRLAICGTGTRRVDVAVNDRPAGNVTLSPGDGVISRHQVQGIWYERELPFDAALMKQGTNTLTLTVPAGPINNGVIYDYVRLELDESKEMAAGE